jgi:hypothetical protein
LIAPSDLAKKIKGYSSKWAHETFPAVRDFSWQDGYGVFAVSKSNVAALPITFATSRSIIGEGRLMTNISTLCRAHEIEFDEAYLLG